MTLLNTILILHFSVLYSSQLHIYCAKSSGEAQTCLASFVSLLAICHCYSENFLKRKLVSQYSLHYFIYRMPVVTLVLTFAMVHIIHIIVVSTHPADHGSTLKINPTNDP